MSMTSEQISDKFEAMDQRIVDLEAEVRFLTAKREQELEDRREGLDRE